MRWFRVDGLEANRLRAKSFKAKGSTANAVRFGREVCSKRGQGGEV